MADGARVLQAGHRDLHAEPVSARRQARRSATPISAKARPRRSCCAINEFREFLSFYPTNPRADYAQYKLGMAHFRQMRAPQRDQTETREAIREFETFVARYPNSSLMPEVQGEAARGARSAERVGLPGRLLLLPPALVPGRDRSLQGAAQGGSGVHPPRRGLLLPRRVARQERSGRPRRCLLRKARRRNSSRASISPLAQKRIAELKTHATLSQIFRRLNMRVLSRSPGCGVRSRRRPWPASAQPQPAALSQLELAVACAPPPTFDPPARRAAPHHRRAGYRPRVPTVRHRATSWSSTAGPPPASSSASSIFVRRANRFGLDDASVAGADVQNGRLDPHRRRQRHRRRSRTFEHACDGVAQGDYLEPFVAPVVPAERRSRRRAGRARLHVAGPGRVRQRGSQRHRRRRRLHADRARQRPGHGAGHAVWPCIGTSASPACRSPAVGEAVVISTSATMSLTRITRARDAVQSGDYVGATK